MRLGTTSRLPFKAGEELGRQLQHFADRTAHGGLERHAGDRFRGAIERQNALVGIGGRQAARQAVDDVLVERLQVGDLGRGLLELHARRPQAVRQRAAEERGGEEPEQVERDRVLRDRPRRQDERRVHEQRIVEEARGGQVLRRHEADVEDGAERGDHQAAAPELHGAGGHDRQHVQRREVAGDAAGDVDERRDDQRVAGELQIEQPPVPLDEPQRQRPGDRQRVGQADQEKERIDGERAGRRDARKGRRAQQNRADDGTNDDEPGDLAAELRVHYVSLLIRSKIGRYIAMTMPPTTTPSRAIMIGSSSVSRPATAVSTSSS